MEKQMVRKSFSVFIEDNYDTLLLLSECECTTFNETSQTYYNKYLDLIQDIEND